MPPMLLLRRSAAVLVSGALAAACATASSSPDPTPRVTPAAASGTASPANTSEPSVGATKPPVSEAPPALSLEPVAEGLVNPISIATAPDGWLLVNEQPGRVVAIHPASGERAVVADLDDRIDGGGERGLLGLALHPDWPEVGRAFIHYSANDGDAILAEFSGGQEGDGPPVIDPGSERILLELPDPYPNHNGGQLAFGPDGFLWMALGDGGSANDPHGHGQDTATLLGSILRLDVTQPGAYAVPPDNPFVDGGGAPEIFLFGLRNPWRFSFDPETDLLWIGDVGQGASEEVDRVDPAADAGANLGWNLMEGAHCFSDPSCSSTGLVLPLTEYGHDLGCSVTGGFVYRGQAIDELAGWYLFADYCTGFLFGIPSDAAEPADGTALAPSLLLETGATVSSFGVDSDGELYLVDHAGGVLSRIAAADG
jgi:glucose/arabinose dehydrogenase